MKRHHVDPSGIAKAALQPVGHMRPDTVVPAMAVAEADDPQVNRFSVLKSVHLSVPLQLNQQLPFLAVNLNMERHLAQGMGRAG